MDTLPRIYTTSFLPLPLLTTSQGGIFYGVTPHLSSHTHPHPGLSFPMKSRLHGMPTPPMDENSPPPKVETFGNERQGPITNLKLSPLTCPESTVNILVESDGKCQAFTLHRDLLCHYSPYFKAIYSNKVNDTRKIVTMKSGMLRREWRWEDVKDLPTLDGVGDEDNIEIEVKVKLPGAIRQHVLDKEKFGDVKRNVFASFMDWLYLGFAGFGLNQHSERQIDASTLIQLWVFAGKVGVPACQNDCVEGIEMWRQNSGTIQTAELGWVYENTKEYKQGDCKLRKLMVDQCAWLLDRSWIAGEEMSSEQSFPRLALLDLVGEMRLLLNSGVNPTRDQPPFSTLERRKNLYWI